MHNGSNYCSQCGRPADMPMDDQLIASDLLCSVKAGITSTAAALTETATPEVHRTLESQLQQDLRFHQQLTNFMMQKGWYQPYNVNQMIQGDLQATQQLQQHVQERQGYQYHQDLEHHQQAYWQQQPHYGQYGHHQPQHTQSHFEQSVFSHPYQGGSGGGGGTWPYGQSSHSPSETNGGQSQSKI